tara:strand:- start:694 stop:1770 length:1077 start_codon:yes stop_codon:yes gene_type:complete
MNFKNFDSDDVLISPFEVNKTFTVTNNDSGSGVYSIPLTKGSDSNLYNWNTTSPSTTLSGNQFFNIPSYYSIKSLYYRDITQMAGIIDFINGVPRDKSGIIEYKKVRHLYDRSVEPSSMTLRVPYTRQLHDSATLISIPQELYGETISKKSVRLVDNSTSPQIILEDDGYGNLYDTAFSASYSNREPDANNSGSVVGNIFYDDGFLVVTDTGSYSNVGDGSFNLTFDSTQTIYEREYICSVEEDEFLHTTNRSLKVGMSGSVAFNGRNFNRGVSHVGTISDGFPYELTGFSTSSFQDINYEIGTELIGEATHSEFATYITTIGLYNDNNELMAIGKTAKPIKNDKEMSLSFVVRFDTN